MPNNINQLFQNYREHARHLRNTAFDTRIDRSWEVIEDFDAVAEVLFDRLVLVQLSEDYDRASRWKDTSYFLIEPSGGGFRVMISRDVGASGYWDHDIEMLMAGEAVIAFHDYFDWDQFSVIDFRYYYGVIIDSQKYPGLVGHHVLIDTDSAAVVANQTSNDEQADGGNQIQR